MPDSQNIQQQVSYVLKDLVVKIKFQRSTRNICKVDLSHSMANIGRNSFEDRAALLRLPPSITIQEIMKHMKEIQLKEHLIMV